MFYSKISNDVESVKEVYLAIFDLKASKNDYSEEVEDHCKQVFQIEKGSTLERNIPTVERKFEELHMRPTMIDFNDAKIVVFNSWRKQDRLDY